MLRNSVEKNVCLYRPNARWGEEFEWLKTLQGPQLENFRTLLSLGVRKPLRNGQTSPHVVWEGFNKNYPSSSKDSVRNLIMGHIWIFQPFTNLKNNTKIGHWAQNQASALAIPVFWPEPCRTWERWTEEKKHQHGAGNLKDLEWFWMKEWSLVSCQVFSNLIRVIIISL